MASPFERPMVAQRHHVAHRRWWQEKHAAFLAVLIGANLAAECFVFRLEDMSTEALFVGVGLLSGQAALMGLWLAFGGLSLPARFFIVSSITIAGACLTTLGIDTDRAEVLRLLLIMSGAIVLATHALLLPLRSLLGWRIDFDRTYHAAQPHRRMQLRLIDWLGFITACALPCALLRFLKDDELVLTAMMGVFAFFGSLPAALLVTVERRSSQAWSLAAAIWAPLLTLEYVSMGKMFNGAPAVIIPFNMGLFAAVLGNLGPLRYWMGLRLFSVVPTSAVVVAPSTAQMPLDPELSRLVAAWSELPEVVRGEIIAIVVDHTTLASEQAT